MKRRGCYFSSIVVATYIIALILNIGADQKKMESEDRLHHFKILANLPELISSMDVFKQNKLGHEMDI